MMPVIRGMLCLRCIYSAERRNAFGISSESVVWLPLAVFRGCRFQVLRASVLHHESYAGF